MKQKLLTLFVLLVTAMTAFADATGSGETAPAGESVKGVKYTYSFTESGGNVTFTVIPDGSNAVGFTNNTYLWDLNHIDGYESQGNTKTWKNIKAGTVIRVQCKWEVQKGACLSEEISYTVEGTEAASDTEVPVMVKAEATTIYDTKATLTLNATDNSNGALTYTVTIGENSYTVTGNAGTDVTIDITGLTPERAYTLAVTAKDQAGNESSAKGLTFTTKKDIF